MSLSIHLTYKSDNKESIFELSESKRDGLLLQNISQPKQNPENGIVRLFFNDNGILSLKDYSLFQESRDVIDSRLLGLTESYIEAKNEGIEITTEDGNDYIEERPGYTPDDIYVENKPFSIQQLIDLIRQGDLDLAPNFQRHFVWDRTRQSLLIESILLGLPLPSIYLSQYPDGMLTVVDGLQRIHTIKAFMENKLRLCNLEYLDNCNGCTFDELKNVLPALYIRRFGQTQLMCFVIDYRSPAKLKFDLFRRLNTGGKPLNNQEIRNCLSRPALQNALNEMSQSDEFRTATSNSVNNLRLQAQEAALRFMYFRRQYSAGNAVGSYNGKMDTTLDDFVNTLNTQKNFDEDIACYKEAMLSAYHLFGEQAFRKVMSAQEKRYAVNKLLMLCISVLLSFVPHRFVIERYRKEELIEPLRHLIEHNEEFYRAITYSTNSKWNIEKAMTIIRDELLRLRIDR